MRRIIIAFALLACSFAYGQTADEISLPAENVKSALADVRTACLR